MMQTERSPPFFVASRLNPLFRACASVIYLRARARASQEDLAAVSSAWALHRCGLVDASLHSLVPGETQA
jgi:hypothetical protein